jgi:hypothetical protein
MPVNKFLALVDTSDIEEGPLFSIPLSLTHTPILFEKYLE